VAAAGDGSRELTSEFVTRLLNRHPPEEVAVVLPPVLHSTLTIVHDAISSAKT
jgi:hypothetical protein